MAPPDVSGLYGLRGQTFDDAGEYTASARNPRYLMGGPDSSMGGDEFVDAPGRRVTINGQTLDLVPIVGPDWQPTGEYEYRLPIAEYMGSMQDRPGEAVYSAGRLGFRQGADGRLTLQDVQFNKEERSDGWLGDNFKNIVLAGLGAATGYGLVGALSGAGAAAAGGGSAAGAAGSAAAGTTASSMLTSAAANAATNAVMQLVTTGGIDMRSLAAGVITSSMGGQISRALASAGVPAAMAPQVTQALIGVARGQDVGQALTGAALGAGLNYAGGAIGAAAGNTTAASGGAGASAMDWNSDIGLDGAWGDGSGGAGLTSFDLGDGQSATDYLDYLQPGGWNSDIGLSGASGDTPGGVVSSGLSFNLGSGQTGADWLRQMAGRIGLQGAQQLWNQLTGGASLTQAIGAGTAGYAALRALSEDAPTADLSGAQGRADALAQTATDRATSLFDRGQALFDQTAPLYQQVIDSNLRAGTGALDRGNALADKAQAAYDQSVPVYQQGIQASQQVAADAAARAVQLGGQYDRAFAPVVDRVASDAMGYDSAGEIARRTAAAGGTVQAQIDAQAGAAERELARNGVSASSGRALMAPAQATMAALGKAGAINKERNDAVMTGIGLRQQAAQTGLQLNNQSAQQSGLALSGNQAAAGIAGAQAGALNTASQTGLPQTQLGLSANTAATNAAGQRAAQFTQASQPGLAATSAATSANNSAAQIGLSKYDADVQAYGAKLGALGNIAGAGTRMALSDERTKEGRAPVDPDAAMEGLRRVPVESWKYKAGAGDGGEHVGPMAQDMNAQFGDEAAPGGQAIDLVSANGIQQAALQSVDARVQRIEQLLSGKGLEAAPTRSARKKAPAMIEDVDAPGVTDHGLTRI